MNVFENWSQKHIDKALKFVTCVWKEEVPNGNNILEFKLQNSGEENGTYKVMEEINNA